MRCAQDDIRHGLISPCPAARRFALSDVTCDFTAFQRFIASAASARALATAATSPAVGVTSAPCIAMAAAIISLLTASSVGGPPAAAPPLPPPNPPRPRRPAPCDGGARSSHCALGGGASAPACS